MESPLSNAGSTFEIPPVPDEREAVTMKILKVSDRTALRKSVAVLRSGGVVVFPTETSYGLGADAENRKAVQRVFNIKRMPLSKKISVMVADKAMAHAWFGKDRGVDALIDAFLPGPLTIVTHGKSFRIPDHQFCRMLSKRLGRPITSTSSNRSGSSDHYSIKPVVKETRDMELVIDGGVLPRRKPSTVYDVDRGIIVRKGPISESAIDSVLKRKVISKKMIL